MSEINMIPLIDVMLVLLIVFMITIPVMRHAVQVNLPQASAERLQPPPEAVRLLVQADGSYRWNDQTLSDAELEQRLEEIAALDAQPPLHLLGDRDVRYERVARVLAAAQRAGVRGIGFVTEPTP
ncbi:MAG: biopolymer transporter ExbD [Tepidimonas sp.]|nr:biopolymer transporter ExbD [Tepidimonas sp.]MDW8335959.1 biopolymer transporter ExbD [Tepidimonas sp.]